MLDLMRKNAGSWIIKGLLGIIATEAIERGGMNEEQWEREGSPTPETPASQNRNLPPIRYDHDRSNA